MESNILIIVAFLCLSAMIVIFPIAIGLIKKSTEEDKIKKQKHTENLMKYAFMAGGYYNSNKVDPEEAWEEFKKTNDGKKD